MLYDLAQKALLAPALLEPGDLAEAVTVYGRRGALELMAILGSFHFINRIADLVGIQSDLPMVQPRWTWLRRLGVRAQGWAMGRFLDMSHQASDIDAVACLEEAQQVLGPLPAGYAQLTEAPPVAAFLTTVSAVVERIDPAIFDAVTPAVAATLPHDEDGATGFHERPSDPIEALAFVGTRYPVRTTDAMLDAVRQKTGYGDPEILDLFYSISMRNALERMNRLMAGPLPAA
ncbi:MAG: hypothetical protein JRS35_04480 [Deltaproteobacteria bacterium]|nr:hypothetical protein [Deltaproteobacteria bacterium]